jgi:hypothetical protein
MKSKQFTLGLMTLILIQLPSFKTVAQCCVSPVDLTAGYILWCPPPQQCQPHVTLSWQRVQKAGCITPVKYRIESREVGQISWDEGFIVITKPDATFFDTTIRLKFVCCPVRTIEWRVQGICSATNKTAWIHGPRYKTLTSPAVSTSSASAASLQGKFTIVAYPNPVAGELKLSGNSKAGGSVSVQIINSVGQTVLRQDHNFNPGNFNTGIDVSKLPPGVYLVVVNDKTERTTLSIVKQ